MHIIRPDLQALARACERLLANGEEPALSEDEKNFVLYYAAELVNRFGKPVNGQLLNPLEPVTNNGHSTESRQSGQSA
jgi:hypothetical protein